MKRQPIYKNLYFQVLVGIAAGILLGYLSPERATAMRPLGDGFIKLIKMLIAPIVFTTVVVGIAQMGDDEGRRPHRPRALVYFEVVSTLALVIGLVVVNVVQAGRRPRRSTRRRSTCRRSPPTPPASQHLTTVDFLLNIIPNTVVDAFASGEILQVLLFSVLFGLALLQLGERGEAARRADRRSSSHALFGIVEMHHARWRRSARSARWRSPSAGTASARCVARQADGRRLSDLRCSSSFVVLGAIIAAGRLQPVEVPALHPRGDPDRPRHLVV